MLAMPNPSMSTFADSSPSDSSHSDSIPSAPRRRATSLTASLAESLADLPLFEEAKRAGEFDASKVVLARVDLNVPLASDNLAPRRAGTTAEPLSFARIDAVRGLIAQVSPHPLLLCSHFGRPRGEPRAELSLRRLLPHLERRWGREVIFLGDSQRSGALDGETLARLGVGGAGEVLREKSAQKKPPIALFENLRFHKGEEQDSLAFAANLASKADIFVNDAFSVCHRAHASTSAITRLLPSYVGCSLARELASLLPLLEFGEQKSIAILGGAKVSTKIKLLRSLIDSCSALALGGNMANCLLAARGKLRNSELALSFSERELAIARELDAYAERGGERGHGCEILLPSDVVLAPMNASAGGARATSLDETSFAATVPPEIVEAEHASRAIWDIGPQSCEAIERLLTKTASRHGGLRVIVNGPLGVFERPPYDSSTLRVLRFVAKMSRCGELRSIGGGGDTIAALERAGVAADFTHVSLGGGAFLELLTEPELPALRALRLCKERMRAA